MNIGEFKAWLAENEIDDSVELHIGELVEEYRSHYYVGNSTEAENVVSDFEVRWVTPDTVSRFRLKGSHETSIQKVVLY